MHRAYGELVPTGAIESFLAAGWRLIEDSCFEPIDGALLAPPRAQGEPPRDAEAA